MPKEYVSKKYEDFRQTNVVWCFDVENGEFNSIKINNLVAGDTDSGYFKVTDEVGEYDIDEIVEAADDVVRSVDTRFPDFLKIAFNCPEERLRSVRTDREVVSDKSFFVTKKRYAMHIIDDEGKRVDKMKIMGLEVKKSDTSKAVKRFLRKIIDLVVEGCTEKDLETYKNEFKKEFYTLPISEIGVPMPATKLSQYEKEFIASGSLKGFPYHYRAALHYNSLCGKMDRKIYPGEKFYVCNIRDMNSKYIGVPVAMNNPPAFVDDVVIDYDAMWGKAIAKFDNYMKSLGWDLQSKMEQQATDVFGVGG